ncbi:hypothetical protein [Paenibacillus sp. AR247]|nr:hypothetical protein [Paenibacillus sp. AR247]
MLFKQPKRRIQDALTIRRRVAAFGTGWGMYRFLSSALTSLNFDFGHG